MGWDLKVGEIKDLYITDQEIWVALNNFFFRSHVTMSYKYGFLKSLIENLYEVNGQLELDYNKLFYSFTKIYWNLVIHHQLWQSNNKKQISRIQKILEIYCENNNIPNELTFDKIPDSLQVTIVNEVKKAGKRYVIGAFYSDTKENFYEFDLKQEKIRFNPPVYKFLQRHQRIVTYMTNYHLAVFLERYNSIPNINYLLTKVEAVSKRESLNQYLKVLAQYDEQVCFYCGHNLSSMKRKTHVDHFIPWSFVQNDTLWNLVIACQTCNTRKSDKLAEEKFLYKLIPRNERLMDKIEDTQLYFFENYNESKLEQLYSYSQINGISDIWVPSV